MAHIITLTTDFGTQDGFVAQMKGVILHINPEALIVDTTHDIEPFSPIEAALVVNGFFGYFPPGTIHLVVVDPGVGSSRRAIVARCQGHYFVGPDNGVFSLVFRNNVACEIREIKNPKFFMAQQHPTFHGRDIFAPVAARLSSGWPFEDVGPSIQDPERLSYPPALKTEYGIEGKVIYVDRFGNLSVNIETSMLDKPVKEINLGSLSIKGLSRTFCDVPDYQPVALINSFGLLEIAINKASAGESLGIGLGARVRVIWGDIIPD
ncbi:MAG: SAM-dependent chlorinase/fluorinase [Deltaproteobacteria bacterium]|nr:SAM-dependent chlorinase/fluorinase [Deltaproteobacteria bacterium]